MNLLAFDTSTETLSLALAWKEAGGLRQREQESEGGRVSSAALIPSVLAMLADAGLSLRDLQAIVFGSGPGSFTGLRTACAVAQGLAFGASRPVLPVETLMAVAEQARHDHGATRVLALLDARMDEVYHASYEHDGHAWRRLGPIALCRPEALTLSSGFVMAGNVFAAYGDRLPAGTRLAALPSAAAMLRMAPGLVAAGGALPADQALPLYVRDKVAQTTEERMALRAAAGAGTP